MFFCEFAKFLRTSFDKTHPVNASGVYQWILRISSEHLFYRAPLRNCLFYVQVAEFQPADTARNYFTGAF